MNKNLKSEQRGAVMVLFALMVVIFIVLSVISAFEITRQEARRVQSGETSAKAYQKAEEAAECSLWGRKMGLENGSDKTYTATKELIFAKDVIATDGYCKQYTSGEVDYYHATLGDWANAWRCASPLWIGGFVTKGEEANKSILLEGTNEGDKIRGIGATASVSYSTLVKPFAVCNRLAAAGEVRDKYFNATYGCTGSISDDLGPSGSRGWLNYWPECQAYCFADACAYYDTSLDDASYANSGNWYATSNSTQGANQGAHWCWTDLTGGGSIDTNSLETGSLCQCLDNSKALSTGANYWKHPDANNFCDTCNRLAEPIRADLSLPSKCGGIAGTGAICGTMASQSWVNQVPASVWGGTTPPAACRGTLSNNNCWSCRCGPFYNEYTNFCTTNCAGNYSCREI